MQGEEGRTHAGQWERPPGVLPGGDPQGQGPGCRARVSGQGVRRGQITPWLGTPDGCTRNIDIIRICIGIPLATHTGEALYLLEVPESGGSPPILHRLPGNC